jgi:hypothetical protein
MSCIFSNTTNKYAITIVVKLPKPLNYTGGYLSQARYAGVWPSSSLSASLRGSFIDSDILPKSKVAFRYLQYLNNPIIVSAKSLRVKK